MKRIQILFGTQTFTSEYHSLGFKEDLLLRYDVEVEIDNIRNFTQKWKDFVEGKEFLILFLANYGDGEPTTDAKEFYKFLKEKTHDLSKMQFTMFGLGDSKYRKYQEFSKNVLSLLKKHGAKEWFKPGYGDGDDTEDDLEEWRSEFSGMLESVHKVTKKEYDDTPKPKYKIKWWSKKKKLPLAFPKFKLIPNRVRPFSSKLLAKRELLNMNCSVDCGELKEVAALDFDLNKSRIMYKEGDHILVYPRNSASLIDEYFTRLKVDKKLTEKFVTVVPINPLVSGYTKNIFPAKTSLHTVFTYYIDLTKPPSKKALRFLSELATDKKDKAELLLLSKYEGKDKYKSVILSKRKRLLDVLLTYPNIQVPLEVFFEITQRLQPRVYSISSCFENNKKIVKLLISKTNYKAFDGRIGYGTCSSYLYDLKVGQEAFIFPEVSEFYLPKDPLVPVVFISVGCAVATYMSFLRIRKRMKEKDNVTFGKSLMFYGCRSQKKDMLFEEELNSFLKSGVLSELHTAFSRDQEKKIYVQHILEKHAQSVYEIMKKKGRIYLCGTIPMSEAVFKTLVKILKEKDENIKTDEDATKLLDEIYQQEVTE